MTKHRTKILAAVVLLGVFLLGSLTGGSVTLLVVRHRVRTVLEGPVDEMETRGLVFALHRKLGLSASQRAQVESIHRKHLPALNRVRMQSERELVPIRATVAAEIRTVLDPEQQTTFDVMVRNFEDRRAKMLGL
jgi:hypothetical protein